MNQPTERRPAVFIDRDGTLVEEVNYLSRIEDLRLFPFTAEAITLLKENGYYVVIVTNQSGIGRQIYDEAAMHTVHSEIQSQLGKAIDGFYFCPHLPCDGCRCRKPNAGMIESATADLPIDLARSWVIGDKRSDVELGQMLGIGSVLVLTGYGHQHHETLECVPDIVEDNLLAAVREIIRRDGE